MVVLPILAVFISILFAAANEQPPAAGLNIAADLVANSFAQPTTVTGSGAAGDARLFVGEKAGVIKIISDVDAGTVLTTPFLDISSLVSDSSERGLLGLAFAPDYNTSAEFYVLYTNNSGDIIVARYSVSADPNVADSGSAQIVMTINQVADFHNGGDIGFGPDGYLYIGLGDDGFGGDSQGDSLIGKMLRIDVHGQTTYVVPADNPFVGNTNYPDEVWALGFRNPWCWSFDRQTGDLWIADVGDDSREEVNFQAATSSGGENYGWPCFEGNLNVNGFGCPGPINHMGPIHDYDHTVGASVTGGYVYRGSSYPQIQGHYFCGDFVFGVFFMMSPAGGGGWNVSTLGSLNVSGGVTSFGEDSGGELYLTTFAGNVYQITESSPQITRTATHTPPGPTATATAAHMPAPSATPTSTPVRDEFQHLPVVNRP